MADVFTKEKRSLVMSKIRSKGNKDTELRLAAILRRSGLNGWRRNWPAFGKPDFVFPRQRLAVFVDGCFWHRCPECYRAPTSNTPYWRAKMERNTKRDALVTDTLTAKGWKVLRIWECNLTNEAKVIASVADALKKSEDCGDFRPLRQMRTR